MYQKIVKYKSLDSKIFKWLHGVPFVYELQQFHFYSILLRIISDNICLFIKQISLFLIKNIFHKNISILFFKKGN